MILRCFLTKNLFARVLPQNEVVCDFVLSCLQWLGHTRIILKTDGERAIQDVVKWVVELAMVKILDLEQISAEGPAAYDSQSNGGTEGGI